MVFGPLYLMGKILKYFAVNMLNKPKYRIPWTEKPGRLQFVESQRVGYN